MQIEVMYWKLQFLPLRKESDAASFQERLLGIINKLGRARPIIGDFTPLVGKFDYYLVDILRIANKLDIGTHAEKIKDNQAKIVIAVRDGNIGLFMNFVQQALFSKILNLVNSPYAIIADKVQLPTYRMYETYMVLNSAIIHLPMMVRPIFDIIKSFNSDEWMDGSMVLNISFKEVVYLSAYHAIGLVDDQGILFDPVLILNNLNFSTSQTNFRLFVFRNMNHILQTISEQIANKPMEKLVDVELKKYKKAFNSLLNIKFMS